MKDNDMARCGLLAGGNWIVDHVKMIDVWPAQDALANIAGELDGSGGGPCNVTKNLAKLGCGFPLAGVGLIGCDADGEMLLRECTEHGVDAGAIQRTTAAPTSYTDVMTVSGTGRRTFFHQHGANALLEITHFELIKSPARIFYLGYLGLLRTMDQTDESGRTQASRVFEQARAAGMITVADLVSNEAVDFGSIVNPSLPYLDYLFLNEYELARLVGAGVTKRAAELEKRAHEVLRRGVQSAVIVHWAEGAVCVVRGGAAVCQPAVRMPADLIVGTVGAGDAFSAGCLLGLHEGWGLECCLELAVCAAAASLRGATATATVESWRNCLALGREMGFHRDIQ